MCSRSDGSRTAPSRSNEGRAADAGRGIDLRTERARRTLVRTLGGKVVEVGKKLEEADGDAWSFSDRHVETVAELRQGLTEALSKRDRDFGDYRTAKD